MEAVRLSRGASFAVVSSRGASLEAAVLGGQAVVEAARGPGEGQYRGAVLAPWPNRTTPLAWRVGQAGGDLLESAGHPGTALHGLVAFDVWDFATLSDHDVTLRTQLDEPPGYPYRLTAAASYALRPDSRLTASFEVRNHSNRRCPVGLGWHPYFSVGGNPDEATLHMRASRALGPDDRGVPRLAQDPPAATLALAGVTLDHSFGLAEPDDDGTRQVQLATPRATVTLRLGPGWPWLHVYTADTLDPPDRRRSVAIEPMTCPANALHTGTDLIWLEEGEACQRSVELACHPVS